MLKTTFPLSLFLLSLWLIADQAAWAQSAPEGFNAGPDIITGDIGAIGGMEQFGSNGTQVGLGVSTTSCNAGNVPVNFIRLPSTEHPIIPHNLYRMSGGSDNTDRFEQVGQSWVKHTFGADQLDDCGFGCTPANFTHLGIGCSDTYAADQNASQDDLGSRALVNPFTGAFQSTACDHSGHTHTATSHRLLVEGSDLNTTLNQGATYYAEVQYISSHEYAWCQTHPGQCNMYNNSSYRRFDVSGTTSFTFSAVGETVRMTPAVGAWTGSTINTIEPAPGVDGRAFIAYKVTGPVAGIWHYEYAIYNENLDRGIQSFTVPLGCGVSVSNLGFHAPPNHPGFLNDGTQGNAGFSNAAWSSEQAATGVTWSSETFAQNQNANAIRWGTLYNFRFDSDHAPLAASATIAFFKTGTSVTVTVLGPCEVLPSPTPTATAAATATPAATPPNPTPTASPTPAASPTPIPAAQALNLSTRMRVQTGDNIGIGGFIITGSPSAASSSAGSEPRAGRDGSGPSGSSKHVLIRALGPSLTQSGVPNALADPVLELHGPDGFIPTSNDNWRDDPAQEALIVATGIPPTNNLESAIEARLYPGAYTALIMGKNNSSGVGLIEVYDLDPAASSKLADISTRAFVSTGNDIVIAGFVLGGDDADDSVIVRGLGPSLTGSGVPNALANPTLELRDENGALLMANNDWQDNAAQAAEINAAGLAPANPLESSIAATLSPGLYTALLTGVNNGTGVGLVEVYDLGAP
jgi:hypothetical protein